MTTSLYSLLAFASWTLAVVVFGIGRVRVTKVMKGEARANEFPGDTPHGPDIYRRTMRAHANCVENLPIFGAVVLIAAVAGVHSNVFDILSVVYVVARVGQTIAHISSGRSRVVTIRFYFFAIQIVSIVTMGLIVATGFTAH